jgi:EAL domain-containing protein (putative c-di-GMP-specific phosphodiesterase class I)
MLQRRAFRYFRPILISQDPRLGEAEAIVLAVLGLSRALAVSVVAESVENPSTTDRAARR